MLVKVRHGNSQKYVKVAQTEEGGYEDYNTFRQKVVLHGLYPALESHVSVPSSTVPSDSSDGTGTPERNHGVERSSTNQVSMQQSTVAFQGRYPSLESHVSDPSSSLPSGSSHGAGIQGGNSGEKQSHVDDRESTKEMVRAVLQSKPGGEKVMKEYAQTKTLTDGTRRQMVNLLVANMMEIHGRFPPIYVRTKYAVGIITLFPNLRDPYSKNGYEHYYDPQSSGSGYLAFRIKTVQRTTAVQSRRCTTSTTHQAGPTSKRDFCLIDKQLVGEECSEAISLVKHSSDASVVKEKMRATFQHRQTLTHDQQNSSTVLDVYPRFLDTPGLVSQDFAMMFGEEASGRFLAKWPTFFKPRILADCKNMTSNEHVQELLSAHDNLDEFGWDSDLSSILLLIHLLPPTSKGPKRAKISSYEAINCVVRYLKMGASIETFLATLEPGQQPFLLCVGDRKNNIQRFYVILDQKAIPCQAQTSLAAFDELFKVHFIFGVDYNKHLNSFYTFIQTTVFNIDVGSAKESPRVKELRARLLHTDCSGDPKEQI